MAFQPIRRFLKNHLNRDGGEGGNSTISLLVDEFEEQWETEDDFRIQVTAIIAFIVTVAMFRFTSRFKALEGQHILDLSNLNSAVMYKEIFLAYLNAAILEPVLSISSMEEINTAELCINIFTLGSICWWIWMVTDAFDFTDVMQQYKYQVELREEASKDRKRYWWFQLKTTKEEDAQLEQATLVGSLSRDISLWFLLACIMAAWLPGVVTHLDVVHAYMIVFLWIITHHACRQATCWGSGYLTTFLFPSSAMMPLEYCVPLMDVADTVEDLDFIESYRIWVKDRTGVELVIQS